MRCMVIVKATADSEAGKMPGERLLTEMGRFNEALVEAGVMLAGDGLHPSARGARVRLAGAAPEVVHGPFAEAGQLVSGYWIWQVGSLDEAIAWAKRCPHGDGGPAELEIRPLFEAEDFGEAMTPELKEQEARLRSKVDGGA